jgi:hypothetical protein
MHGAASGEPAPAGQAMYPNLHWSAMVDDIRAQGMTSVRKITDELNRRNILTARSAAWHPTTTARLLARLA